MELDALLSGTKWGIIEHIARKESSPLELAKALNTTVANVSMQLRLLEVANLVVKRKVGNAQAGKPRVLYQLKKDILYVLSASSLSQFKRSFELTQERAFILKTWQLPQIVQGPLLYFYVKYPLIFSDKYDVYYVEHGDGVVKIIITNDKKSLPPKIVDVQYKGEKYAIDVRFVSQSEIEDLPKLTLIHNGLATHN